MSIIIIHYQCPLSMSIINFHYQYPFSMSLINVHYQSPFSMSLINVPYQCPLSMSIINLHYQCPLSMSVINYPCQVGHVPGPDWACQWSRLGMSLVQVGHVPGPGWTLLRGPKIPKIARGHNSTHTRAQNFSTTAPGRKFRDLQVPKIQKIQNLDPGIQKKQKNGGSAAWGVSRVN